MPFYDNQKMTFIIEKKGTRRYFGYPTGTLYPIIKKSKKRVQGTRRSKFYITVEGTGYPFIQP